MTALPPLAAAAPAPPPSPWVVGALVATAVFALAAAVAALVAQRARAETVGRLGRRRAGALALRGDDALRDASAGGPAWLALATAFLARVVPAAMRDEAAAARMAGAGWRAPAAPLWFAAARVSAPLLGVALVLVATGEPTPLALGLGLLVGWVAPTAVVDRRAGERRTALTVAIPDAIDLLVVCLEAGVGIDAALLRVSRELAPTHPVLSAELEDVTRRIGAGLPREEALRALVARSGVDDLRAVVGTMIQAERLGTSLARVLRVHGETLRTRRRQLAEKKAAEASVKMVIPLVVFLLPAFFAVVLGPAVLSMLKLSAP